MKNTMSVITFIGAGKIAYALIGGLIKSGHQPENIWASCPTQSHLDELKNQLGIHITTDNTLAAASADILVLAVKPHLILEVLIELQPLISRRNPLIISVAAGVTESAMLSVLSTPLCESKLSSQADAYLASSSGIDISIIRAMPNTPALIGRSMTALYTHPSTSLVAKEQAEAIFKAIGAIVWIQDENQMSLITALSGSGPAYFFLLMEALENAGIALGLSPEIAHQLTLGTAMGSAYLAAGRDESLYSLRKNVTAKGGGTEQAVRVLESGQFSQLLLDAVAAAKKRYDELSVS